MRDRIIVKKELIPYGFNIALGKDKFNMRFAYNHQADLLRCHYTVMGPCCARMNRSYMGSLFSGCV